MRVTSYILLTTNKICIIVVVQGLKGVLALPAWKDSSHRQQEMQIEEGC